MNWNDFFLSSAYFGVGLSLLCYLIAVKIANKFPYTILNPLLVSSLLVIGVLSLLNVDYDTYNISAKYLTYLLTPATVCLAVPMYRQIQVLKKNLAAILVSIFAGCLACALTVLGLSVLMEMDPMIYHSLQPKSITTAIAMGISTEIGGNETITVAVVIFTGLIGAMLAKTICRLFKITHPVAVGLACGNSAHAIGTSKALEIGELEGAMSSLSIVVAGVFTVILAPIMARFM